MPVNSGQYVPGVALLQPHMPGFQAQMALVGRDSADTLPDTQVPDAVAISPIPKQALFQSPPPSEQATLPLPGTARPVATAQNSKEVPEAKGSPPSKEKETTLQEPPAEVEPKEPPAIIPLPDTEPVELPPACIDETQHDEEKEDGQRHEDDESQAPPTPPSELDHDKEPGYDKEPGWVWREERHHQSIEAPPQKKKKQYQDGTYWRTGMLLPCLHFSCQLHVCMHLQR